MFFLPRLKHSNLWPEDSYEQLKNHNFYKPILPTILKNNISEKIINVLKEDEENKKTGLIKKQKLFYKNL